MNTTADNLSTFISPVDKRWFKNTTGETNAVQLNTIRSVGKIDTRLYDLNTIDITMVVISCNIHYTMSVHDRLTINRSNIYARVI